MVVEVTVDTNGDLAAAVALTHQSLEAELPQRAEASDRPEDPRPEEREGLAAAAEVAAAATRGRAVGGVLFAKLVRGKRLRNRAVRL